MFTNTTLDDQNLTDFKPRVDGELFVGDQLEALENAPAKPTLVFLNENEGLAFSQFALAIQACRRIFLNNNKKATFIANLHHKIS